MSLQNQPDEEQPEGVEETEEYGEPVRLPVPIYTYVILGSIIAVAVVQFVSGLQPSILAAGFVKPAFIRNHEYWRILTGATVHGGIAHIAMNSYALYSFGRIFEMLSNRAHLAIVFLLSAIAGGILSLIFLPGGISVGASGGIVGLVGYLAVYTFKRRQFISPQFRRSILINIGFIIIFGLALYQVIDNFGHIGGLITGAVYGLFQIPSDPYNDPSKASSFVQIAGLASLGIFVAACIFSIVIILNLT